MAYHQGTPSACVSKCTHTVDHMPALTDAIGIGRAHYGPGIGNIYFDDVRCNGTEPNITDCPHRGIGSHNCGHLEDASVLCKREFV